MKKSLILAFIFSLNLIACDWRVFEDLKNSATVMVIESPDEFSGANFGQVISPLKNNTGEVVTDKIIIGGSSPNPLILVDFAENVITRHPVIFTDNITLDITGIVPLKSEGGEYRIAVSSQEKIHFLRISFDEETGYSAAIIKTLNENTVSPGFGRAFDILEARDTIMVATSSDNGFFIYPSVDINESGDSTRVLIEVPEGFSQPVDGDSFIRFVRSEQENFLAIGGSDTAENIWALALVSTSAEFSPGSQLPWLVMRGNTSHPGDEVVNIQAGDLNSDGRVDIAAAVSGQIYIFYSGIESGDYPLTPSSVLYVNNESTGHRMVISDINNDGVNEVISSDPQGSSSSKVYIHMTPVLTSPLSPAVTIKTPENEKYFGSSFAAVPTELNPERNELFIGGMNSVYLFYITGFEGDRLPQDDPRN